MTAISQPCATPGVFALPDMDAKRIALDPWLDLNQVALEAAASLMGKPLMGLTAFIPLELHAVGLALIYDNPISLRLLDTERFPNALCWALTDYQTTITSEPSS